MFWEACRASLGHQDGRVSKCRGMEQVARGHSFHASIQGGGSSSGFSFHNH